MTEEPINNQRTSRLITSGVILLCVVIFLQLGILLQRQIVSRQPHAHPAFIPHSAKPTLVSKIHAWLFPKPTRDISPDTVWDPSDQMAHMHEQINRMFEQTVRDSFGFPLAPAAVSNATTSGGSAPFAHINRMRHEIDALFAMALNDFEGPHPGFDDGWAELDVTPGMSVRDTQSAYEITVNIPGVDKSNLHVSMEGQILSIVVASQGQHRLTDNDSKTAWQSRRASRFERRLRLPAATSQRDTIKATYDNGVLRIVVPKETDAESTAGQIKVI